MILRTKKDLHIERKVFHIFGVTTLFVCLHLFSRPVNIALLTGGLIFSVGVDVLRLRSPSFNKWVLDGWMGYLARAEEKDSISSVTHMIIGVGLCFAFFSETITAVSLLFLGLGDPFASTCGILWGKTKILGSKSLEGSLGCAVICTVAYWVYTHFNFTIPQGVLGVCGAGALGAVSELIPVGKLDDNLSQPLISGALLTALFYFIG